MSSTTATHSDVVRLLSSVSVIAQSDSRNREYLISWLQKKVLNSYFLSEVLFPSFLGYFLVWKELACLFYKSLLPFLTFVNCKDSYGETSSQHFSIFRYVFAQLGVIPRARNKFVEIVSTVECSLIITLVKKMKNERNSHSEYVVRCAIW